MEFKCVATHIFHADDWKLSFFNYVINYVILHTKRKVDPKIWKNGNIEKTVKIAGWQSIKANLVGKY